MLGNLGGLYDLFCHGLSFIFGLLSLRLLDVSQVTTLFKCYIVDSNDGLASPLTKFDSMVPFKMKLYEQLLYIFSCRCKLKNFQKRTLEKGLSKLER